MTSSRVASRHLGDARRQWPWLSALVLLGCACSSPTATPHGATPDAGVITEAGAEPGDAGHEDAGPLDSGTTCDDACRTTALVATMNGVSRTLDRAVFGTEALDAGEGLYVEAHQGGADGCPTDSTPAPDRTVTIANVPAGNKNVAYTDKDGLRVALLDFVGDQLTDAPLSKASSVTVTIVAEDRAAERPWVALDLDATFAEGSVKGHVFASYCEVLSR